MMEKLKYYIFCIKWLWKNRHWRNTRQKFKAMEKAYLTERSQKGSKSTGLEKQPPVTDKVLNEKINEIFIRYSHLYSQAEEARHDEIEAMDGAMIEMQSVWDVLSLHKHDMVDYEEMNRLQENIETCAKARLLNELEKDFKVMLREISERYSPCQKTGWRVCDTRDVLYSSNSIIGIWCVDPDDPHYLRALWRGMAWEIPEEYASLPFKKFFGSVPEHLYEADTINIMIDVNIETAERLLNKENEYGKR